MRSLLLFSYHLCIFSSSYAHLLQSFGVGLDESFKDGNCPDSLLPNSFPLTPRRHQDADQPDPPFVPGPIGHRVRGRGPGRLRGPRFSPGRRCRRSLGRTHPHRVPGQSRHGRAPGGGIHQVQGGESRPGVDPGPAAAGHPAADRHRLGHRAGHRPRGKQRLPHLRPGRRAAGHHRLHRRGCPVLPAGLLATASGKRPLHAERPLVRHRLVLGRTAHLLQRRHLRGGGH